MATRHDTARRRLRAVTFAPAPARYERMLYNRAGRSGLKLSAVSLGLWQNFGHDRPLDTSRAIVRRAFDRGITHFDLANNYAVDERTDVGDDDLGLGTPRRTRR